MRSYKIPTSFPGSLFSASIVVETMEAEKRDPGNEVDKILPRSHQDISHDNILLKTINKIERAEKL